MAQMVPGDQINVALRKQLLLGMFPASPAAAHSHFYYLLFFRTAAGVSLQLCGNMLKAGPRQEAKGLLGLVPGPWQRAAPGYAGCLPGICGHTPPCPLDGAVLSSSSRPAWSSTIPGSYIVCLYLV